MIAFLGDWLNLLIRWAHLVVGIGWIGTSFYFIWLDYTLRERERMNAGVRGTSWLVHGGGFYHVEKYAVAPDTLPPDLHWFKWEAYLTWATGFALLIVQYFWRAEIYLIDPAVLPLTAWQAVAISVVSFVIGWLIYYGLCRLLAKDRPVLLALCVFILIVGAAFLYTQVFSARGAFLHAGALAGTIMAVNVFAVIIPNQKIMIGQMMRGETPDARFGIVGKQRSLHNNYLTLPVLLMMVSPHYPFLSAHPHAWLVVALIFLTGGFVRHLLNRAEAGDSFENYAWALPVAAFALIATIYATAPREIAGGAVSETQALEIVQKHCAMCHAKSPSHASVSEAPKGIALESSADIRRHAAAIMQQTVQSTAMPLGNQTNMKPAEREALGRWIGSLK
jgi:uncharacterized membrane protein